MTGGGGKHVGAKSSQVGFNMKNLRQREDTAKYLLNLNQILHLIQSLDPCVPTQIQD